MAAKKPKVLYYGDNLDVLRRHIPDESVDLVYLDPPFKSNQDYNILFEDQGTRAAAQVKAFQDTWTWDKVAAAAYREITESGGPVAEELAAFRSLLGDSDMLAYLSMMAPRLVELHRVLKDTGSLYLHCDPSASHYLRVLLDAIFAPRYFRNEITWKRTSAHSDTKQGMRRYGRIRDLLLFYTKTDQYTWNPQYTPYADSYVASEYRHVDSMNGRRYKEADVTAARPGGDTSYEWRVKRAEAPDTRWEADLNDEWRRPQAGFQYLGVPPYTGRYWAYSRANMEAFAREGLLIHRKTGMPRLKLYADEMPGIALQDLWDDITPVSGNEDLGYPTQKPEILLERIITASSNKNDLVLDPFCGCGTAIAVADRLGRRWTGIDITHLAYNLIRHRLLADGNDPTSYQVVGEPVDADGAGVLAREDPYQFQWWALGLVGARPIHQKKGADRGIDGRLYYHDGDDKPTRQIVLSVKAGALKASYVRDLLGVVERERVSIGVLLTLNEPTAAMRRDATSAGFYESPAGALYPRLQIITVAELLAGAKIDYPATGPGIRYERAPEQLVLEAERSTGTSTHATSKGVPATRTLSDIVDDLLQRARIQQPPVRLEPILEELGMELSADPRMREDAMLVPMTDPARGPVRAWTVYYNPRKPENRRRFTLAHEVGHVVLHGQPHAAAARGGGPLTRREREADAFAATLLIPEHMLRSAVREYGADVESLSAVFQVSRAAMEIRLTQLGIG